VGYTNEGNSLIYWFADPNLTDEEEDSLREIGKQFLKPFGFQ